MSNFLPCTEKVFLFLLISILLCSCEASIEFVGISESSNKKKDEPASSEKTTGSETLECNEKYLFPFYTHQEKLNLTAGIVKSEIIKTGEKSGNKYALLFKEFVLITFPKNHKKGILNLSVARGIEKNGNNVEFKILFKANDKTKEPVKEFLFKIEENGKVSENFKGLKNGPSAIVTKLELEIFEEYETIFIVKEKEDENIALLFDISFSEFEDCKCKTLPFLDEFSVAEGKEGIAALNFFKGKTSTLTYAKLGEDFLRIFIKENGIIRFEIAQVIENNEEPVLMKFAAKDEKREVEFFTFSVNESDNRKKSEFLIEDEKVLSAGPSTTLYRVELEINNDSHFTDLIKTSGAEDNYIVLKNPQFCKP